MIDVSEWVWIFDGASMMCRNAENEVVVAFEKVEGVYAGKLRDIPMKLIWGDCGA